MTMGESVDSDPPACPPAAPPATQVAVPPACPTPGLYRHYKGAEYRVLGCARHSESEEWLVLYRALYGERGLWVRPLAMFADQVGLAGERVVRFALVRAEAGLADDGD